MNKIRLSNAIRKACTWKRRLWHVSFISTMTISEHVFTHGQNVNVSGVNWPASQIRAKRMTKQRKWVLHRSPLKSLFYLFCLWTIAYKIIKYLMLYVELIFRLRYHFVLDLMGVVSVSPLVAAFLRNSCFYSRSVQVFLSNIQASHVYKPPNSNKFWTNCSIMTSDKHNHYSMSQNKNWWLIILNMHYRDSNRRESPRIPCPTWWFIDWLRSFIHSCAYSVKIRNKAVHTSVGDCNLTFVIVTWPLKHNISR